MIDRQAGAPEFPDDAGRGAFLKARGVLSALLMTACAGWTCATYAGEAPNPDKPRINVININGGIALPPNGGPNGAGEKPKGDKPKDDKDQAKGPDHNVTLNEEAGVLELLKKAQKAREKAETDPQAWPECVKHYSEILKKYPNTVYLERWEGTDPKDPAAMAWKNGLYKSTRERVARDIASLPAGGLSIYRIINDPPARNLYNDAAENFDERKMEQAATEYFPTSFGDDALAWLSELAYGRNAPRLALMRLNQTLEHPSSSVPKVSLLARKTLVLAKAGDAAGAEKALKETETASADPKNGELIVGHARGADALKALKERVAAIAKVASAPVVETTSTRNWETYFGNSAHNGVAQERKAVGLLKWSVPTQKLLYGPNADEEPPRRIGDMNGNPIPDPTIPYNLSIRGDTFYINDYMVMAAYPVNNPRPGAPGSGNAVFFYPSDPTAVKAGGVRDRQRRMGRLYGTFVRHHPHFVTLAGERVFGAVGAEPGNQDPQMWGGGQEQAQPANYMVSLTKSGKLQWALTPDVKNESYETVSKADQEWLKSIFFPASPTYDNGVLYAMAAKTSGLDEAWACAFDAASGRLLWRTLLCSANPVLVGGPVQPDLGLPVAVSNNTVFVVTNLGAVVSLDALSGGIKWLRVYDRAQVQERFARFGRGRSDFWAPNPPIVHDRIVICTPQDSDLMYAYDIETGRRVWEVQRILPNERDRLKHVLGIVHNALVVSGNDIHFFGLKSGPEVFVLDQLESPIKGHGTVAGDSVLVPTEKSLLCIDTQLVENRVQAKIRESYKWAEPEREAGNVFVAGDVLYTISNTHVNAYFVWEEVAKKLRERIQKDAQDLPAYLELSDTYLKIADFDSGLKLLDQAQPIATQKKDDPKFASVIAELNRKKYELLLGLGDAAKAKTDNAKAYEQFKKAYETALLPGVTGDLAVTALARMADTSKAQNEMARAVEHYHQMILKHGDVTVGEAPNQQRARLLAQSKIEEIRKLDPKAYEKIEAEARLSLDQAAADTAKLLNVVSLYPNSNTSGEALLKLARLTLAKRPDQARQHLQRYLSRFGTSPEAPIAQALMAVAYEKGGLLGPAKDILTRLANRPEFAIAKIPTDPLADGSASVTAPEWAKQRLANEAYQRPLSASTAALGDGKLKEVWTQTAPEAAQAVMLDGSPPGVMRRNVFLIEKQNELLVLGPDGSEEWAPRPKLPAGVFSRGIWAENLLLFVGTREIVALDSNERGRVAWRRELNIPNTRQLQCVVKAAAGRVVIAYPSGGLSVLEGSNGEVLWQTQLDGNQLYKEPAIGDGFIAVAAQNPARVHLFELDTGKKRGAIDQAAGGFSVAPLAQGDRAFFAERNVVKAVEGSTGKLVWEHTLGGEATSLFAGRDWVIAGSDDRDRPVIALSADGAGERKMWAPVLPRGCRARSLYVDGDDLLVMLDSPGGKAGLYSFSISKQGKLNWEVELSKEAAAVLPLGENSLAVGHALTTQANWDPTGDRPSALVLVDRRSGKLAWSSNLSSDGIRNVDENGMPLPNFSAQLFDGGVLVVEGRKRTIFAATEARGDEDALKALKEQLAKSPDDAKLKLKLATAQFASPDPAQKESALALQGQALASGKLSAADFNEAYTDLQRMRSELLRSRKRRIEFAKADADVDAALKAAPELVLNAWRDVYLQREDDTVAFAPDGFGGETDLKVSFRGAYDAKNLHLQFVVTDDVHKNDQAEGAYCDLGDSVRLVFDIDRDGGLGYRGDDFELCAALNGQGKVLAWRFVERGRYLGAEAALNPAPTIVRDEAAKTTTYRFALSLEYLKLKPDAGTAFGFSFGVNDQDGGPAVKKSMSASPGVQRPPYPGLFGEGVLK